MQNNDYCRADINADRIAELFNALKQSGRVLKSAEVTVECNPDSVTRRGLAALRREGFESRHNMKYWDLDDYIGFGPGAHSCMANTRYSYVRDLEAYISAMTAKGGSVIDEYETLSELDRAAEYVLLGMRRGKGISREEYTGVYRSDFAPLEKELERFRENGWARQTDGRWAFTPEGFLRSNQLILTLLEAQGQCRLSVNPWVSQPPAQAGPA